MRRRRCAGLLLAALVAGCGDAAPHAAPPATVANPRREADLTTVTLTAEAEGRLGITTAPAEQRDVARVREVGGEIVAPPGSALMVLAPFAGTVEAPSGGAIPGAGAVVEQGASIARLVLLPSDPNLGRAQEEVDIAAARLQVASARAERARALRERSLISAADAEDAAAAEVEAQAAVRAAEQRLRILFGTARGDTTASALVLRAPRRGVVRQVNVAAGQTVAASAPLFEIVSLDPAWVRVPLYAGDVRDVAPGAAVTVRDAAGSGPAAVARPIAGPPTADAAAASVDLWFELPGAAWRPGQRVLVHLALRRREARLVVPWSAVVFDASGGAWVYERREPHVYVRRRVDIAWVAGDLAVLRMGPAAGTAVVTAGAAELFGTEFGGGK